MKKSKSDEYGNKISDEDMKYVDDELDFSKKRLEDEKKSLQYIKNNPKKYKAKKSLEKAGIGAVPNPTNPRDTFCLVFKENLFILYITIYLIINY